jgi:hypothetical protein
MIAVVLDTSEQAQQSCRCTRDDPRDDTAKQCQERLLTIARLMGAEADNIIEAPAGYACALG